MPQTKNIPATSCTTLSGMVIHYNPDHGFGQVNTADGGRWRFDYKAVSGIWVPGPGDLVEFELLDNADAIGEDHSQIGNLRLVKHQDAETAGRDDLIECPHCHKTVYPRIVAYEGAPDVSYCPECGKVISEFGKNDRIFWILFAVVVIVSLMVGVSIS